jgi:predicted transcriptional regulator
MKRQTMFPHTVAFRVTDVFRNELEALAAKASRNPSDLVREAVWLYVARYRDSADEIRRVI